MSTRERKKYKDVYVYTSATHGNQEEGGSLVALVGILRALMGDDECITNVQFVYAESWLKRKDRFPLDPVNLPLRKQPFQNGRDMFGVFLDATPDDWGTRLILLSAKSVPRNQLEWVIAGSGKGVGSLIFCEDHDEAIAEKSLSDRPVLRLDDLLSLSDEIQRDDGAPLAGDEGSIGITMLRQTWYGNSIGGARPKFVIVDKGREFLAKFNRPHDVYDQVLTEFACMNMARVAGLNVPPLRLEKVYHPSQKGHSNVLLIERFDRDEDNRAIHFISASALRSADTKHNGSYAQLAQLINKVSGAPKEDLREMFARMVFNVLVGNTDDHMRNHAFIFKPEEHAFRLSPLFDVVSQPAQASEHYIFIAGESRASSLKSAVANHAMFLLSLDEAKEIVLQQMEVVKNAKRFFCEAGMTENSATLMARCCTRHIPPPMLGMSSVFN